MVVDVPGTIGRLCIGIRRVCCVGLYNLQVKGNCMSGYDNLPVESLTHLEAAGPTVHRRQDVDVSGKRSNLYSGISLLSLKQSSGHRL